ncbi:MAG: nickel-responsive transcriptional regulator NikR [Rhodospirillales bacterium]|nr:nickel-responsive transcriptional regulator NikR [Rhodospirillales bacterium]
MQRITISVDDALLAEFDALMQLRGYSNRSEAFRDLVRERLERERFASVSAPACIGCLTYVYDHSERELPRRLIEAQHAHHDLTISTIHLHLDHENCMEAAILRGPTQQVTAFAGTITAQRGVRHGHLWLVPVDLRLDSHEHTVGDHPSEPHVHSRPKT